MKIRSFLSVGVVFVATQISFAAELPGKYKDAGEVRVGSDVSSSYVPFEYFGPDGATPEGFDIDLASALSERLGIPFVINNISFDGLITGLKSNRIDLVLSGAGDTKARQEEVTFVDYAQSPAGILQRESDNGLRRIADTCGLRVATQNGSLFNAVVRDQSEKCVKDGKAPIAPNLFESRSDAVLAVRSDRVDIFVESLNSFRELPAGLVAYAAEDRPANKIGMAVRKDEMDLAQSLQAAVQSLIDDGTYNSLIEKWKLRGAEIEAATINGGAH